MGAYCITGWSVFDSWKQAVRKKQKLILHPRYKNLMYEECVMAVVFRYRTPLLQKILLYSLPDEYADVLELFNGRVDITFDNGNLVISN